MSHCLQAYITNLNHMQKSFSTCLPLNRSKPCDCKVNMMEDEFKLYWPWEDLGMTCTRVLTWYHKLLKFNVDCWLPLRYWCWVSILVFDFDVFRFGGGGRGRSRSRSRSRGRGGGGRGRSRSRSRCLGLKIHVLPFVNVECCFKKPV